MGNPQAVATLEAAGRAAAAAGAIEAAAAHYEHALQLAGPAGGPELRCTLAEACIGAGRPAEALAPLSSLLEQPDLSAHERAEALRVLGMAQALTGSFEKGQANLLAAAGAIEQRDPARAAAVLATGLSLVLLAQGVKAARPLEQRARSLAPLASPGTSVTLDAYSAVCDIMAGDASGWERAAQALRRGEADARVPGEVLNLSVRITYVAGGTYLERFEEAAAAFEVGYAQAERLGSAAEVAYYGIDGADLLARCSTLEAADELLERAANVADLVPAVALGVAVARAQLAFEQGATDKARRLCEAVESDFGALQSWVPLIWMKLRALQARLALDAGQPHRAAALCAGVEALARSSGYREPCVAPWHGTAIAANLAAGDQAEVERLVSDLEGLAGNLPCRWPLAAAHTGRALWPRRATTSQLPRRASSWRSPTLRAPR